MNNGFLIEDLFIAPGQNLTKEDVSHREDLLRIVSLTKSELRRRWYTLTGMIILSAWRDRGRDRAVLDRYLGSYYGHTDLRGAPFQDESLDGTDLSYIDFFGSILVGASLKRANLTQSWLSESLVRGADFSNAILDGALVDNLDFDENTNFRGVNLSQVNFNLADRLKEQAIAQNLLGLPSSESRLD